MELRRFNEAGLAELRERLLAMKTEPGTDPPRHLLADPGLTETVEPTRSVVEATFSTRMEAAVAVNRLLGEPPPPGTLKDSGLWSWLALAHFDSICPPDGDGRRKVGALHRYILEGANHKTYYRHLLLGPYAIFRAHRDEPERAVVLLCQPPHAPGDIVEQLASRQEIVANPVMMRMATELYYHPVTGTPKRGAGSKQRGSARRLAEVADQFDVTWDLFAVPWHALLARLPREFDRFRPEAKSTMSSPGVPIHFVEQADQ